jgi:hypothetical protein
VGVELELGKLIREQGEIRGCSEEFGKDMM